MVNVKITNDSKVFWKSKTFQLSVMTTLIGVLTTIMGNLETGIPITLMSVIMIIMRTISKNALSFYEEK